MAQKRRLLGVYDQLEARLKDAPRQLSFANPANKKLIFTEWKARFKAKILELIGPFPPSVPLEMEVLEEETIEDYIEFGIPPFIQQKIVYNSEKYASVAAYLLRPADLKPGEKRPAILNAHGHGSGKSQMVNMDPANWLPNRISYEATAIHLVAAGFIVIAPDWRPFGERILNKEFARDGRDPCNVSSLGFAYFGHTLLGLNVHDAKCTLDLLESLPYVDASRIGMIGKSYGGTMTTYATALDDRIKAAVVSGYLSTLNDAISMRGKGNYCGSQHLPGLLLWGDIPDVVGLIAPRPLLIEAGTKDDCFIFEDSTKAYGLLQEIYRAAGAAEKLDRDVAEVKHEIICNKMIPFFKKNL